MVAATQGNPVGAGTLVTALSILAPVKSCATRAAGKHTRQPWPCPPSRHLYRHPQCAQKRERTSARKRLAHPAAHPSHNTCRQGGGE